MSSPVASEILASKNSAAALGLLPALRARIMISFGPACSSSFQPHRDGLLPIFAAGQLLAVDPQREFVVAGDHGPSLLRPCRQLDLAAQHDLFARFGDAVGAFGITPNPLSGERAGRRRPSWPDLKIAGRLRRAGVGAHPDRVEELFGGQSPDLWAAEDELLRIVWLGTHAGQLIGPGRDDPQHEMFQVVAVGAKVGGQPIQHVFIPGRIVDFVDRLDECAAEETSPQSIDDRPPQPRVSGRRSPAWPVLSAAAGRLAPAVNCPSSVFRNCGSANFPVALSQRKISSGWSANTPASA